MNESPLTVGLVRTGTLEIHRTIAQALCALGCTVHDFDLGASPPEGIDLLLAYGPNASLSGLAHELRRLPVATRPLLGFWFIEALPNPALPRVLWTLGGRLRAQVGSRSSPPGSRGQRGTLLTRKVLYRTIRYRNYGELLSLRRLGVLDLLFVNSQIFEQLLRRVGFDPQVAYLGGDELAPPPFSSRDVDVLWIGWPGTRRRRALLQQVQKDLAVRGYSVVLADGVQRPLIMGADRALLLQRSKVVLNLLSMPWDDNSYRFHLAAHAGALIASEPTLPHTPFLPGIHYLEASSPQLAASIATCLGDEDTRRRIVEQAHQLVTTTLTMTNGVATILDNARRLLKARRDA